MDYEDEQNNEIEALESIYCGEMKSKCCKAHQYRITVRKEQI
jgi:hypothetical protein